MLHRIGARPQGEPAPAPIVRMPWKRLPTDRSRRRKVRRALWLIAAVLLVLLAAGLLIWIDTVWTADPVPEKHGTLFPLWSAP